MSELKDAAEEWARIEWEGIQKQIRNGLVSEDAFLAGAQWERNRILGMLRSRDTFNAHRFTEKHKLSNEQFADWIEKKLKQEDG